MPKLNKLIMSRGLYQKLSGSAGIHFQERKENSRSSAESFRYAAGYLETKWQTRRCGNLGMYIESTSFLVPS